MDALLVPVCKHCGVVAPTHVSSCESCRARIEESKVPSPVEGTLTWAALRAAFTCRACGFPSPLDGIPTEDGAACAQCGTYQRIDAFAWNTILPVAHDVGDLGGPHREGIHPSPFVFIGDLNPYRAVGDVKTFTTIETEGLHAEACPGHPVCKACGRLADVRIDANGVTTRCAGCGDTATFVLPPGPSRGNPQLRGVVSSLQRADRKAAVVQRTSTGLVALVCPQCGAAVTPKDEHTVACGYCHTVSWIPAQARGGSGNAPAPPIVFWVVFDGPSTTRAKLEKPAPTEMGKPKTGVWYRGLDPLPGVMLAPERKVFDVRQWGLTVVLTLLALALGYGILALAGVM